MGKYSFMLVIICLIGNVKNTSFIINITFLGGMGVGSCYKKARNLFAGADIEINGKRAWDIQIFDDRFYKRLFAKGSLGVGRGLYG